MCVILVGSITKEQHKLALAQNPDGFSLFTEEAGLVKSPSKTIVDRSIGKFGIWHYRIGTSGKMDSTNIHPFEICGGKYLLYHNGILGDGLGDLSDTAALANTLKNASYMTAKSVLASLSKGQRFLVVDAFDPIKYLLYGDWVASAGVLMSHRMYKPVLRRKPYSYTEKLSMFESGGE